MFYSKQILSFKSDIMIFYKNLSSKLLPFSSSELSKVTLVLFDINSTISHTVYFVAI